LPIDKEKDIYSLPRAVSISDQGLRMTQEVEIDDIYIKHSTEVGGAGFVDKELKFIGEPIDLKGFYHSKWLASNEILSSTLYR